MIKKKKRKGLLLSSTLPSQLYNHCCAVMMQIKTSTWMTTVQWNLEMGNTRTHLGSSLPFCCAGEATLSSRLDISFPWQWKKLYHGKSPHCPDSTPQLLETPEAHQHLQWITETNLLHLNTLTFSLEHRKATENNKPECFIDHHRMLSVTDMLSVTFADSRSKGRFQKMFSKMSWYARLKALVHHFIVTHGDLFQMTSQIVNIWIKFFSGWGLSASLP